MESKGVARIRVVMAVEGKELQLPDYVKDKIGYKAGME